MNNFLRRLLRLLLPLIVDCLDEVLDKRDLKDGQRINDSKVHSND